MSRRAQAPVRSILPDPKFNNDMLAKFMNVIMKSGKKSAAERIIYGALDRIGESTELQRVPGTWHRRPGVISPRPPA